MEFLISAIDVNTCVDIIHIAEVFGMPQLEDKATKFMLDRFPDFMKSSQLQKLTFDNMAALLESNVTQIHKFVMQEHALMAAVLLELCVMLTPKSAIMDLVLQTCCMACGTMCHKHMDSVVL